MEINYSVQTVVPCPTNSLKEIFVLPLDIRLAGCDFVGPITYRDAHVIESKMDTDSSSFSASGGWRLEQRITRMYPASAID